jgi:hypothetical protein
MNAAIEHGFEATSPAQTKPPLRLNEKKFQNVDWAPYVLAEAKKVALKADWPLRQWDEFIETACACFTEAAEPEEQKKFLAVVRERFEVQTYTPRGGRDD